VDGIFGKSQEWWIALLAYYTTNIFFKSSFISKIN